jgi:hypothetical protein
MVVILLVLRHGSGRRVGMRKREAALGARSRVL